MNKILIIITLFCLFSCSNPYAVYKGELEKSAKSSSASSRINQSQSNNSEVFKELDE